MEVVLTSTSSVGRRRRGRRAGGHGRRRAGADGRADGGVAPDGAPLGLTVRRLPPSPPGPESGASAPAPEPGASAPVPESGASAPRPRRRPPPSRAACGRAAGPGVSVGAASAAGGEAGRGVVGVELGDRRERAVHVHDAGPLAGRVVVEDDAVLGEQLEQPAGLDQLARGDHRSPGRVDHGHPARRVVGHEDAPRRLAGLAEVVVGVGHRHGELVTPPGVEVADPQHPVGPRDGVEPGRRRRAGHPHRLVPRVHVDAGPVAPAAAAVEGHHRPLLAIHQRRPAVDDRQLGLAGPVGHLGSGLALDAVEPGQVAAGLPQEPQAALAVHDARPHGLGHRHRAAPQPVDRVGVGDGDAAPLLVEDVEGVVGREARDPAGGAVDHGHRLARGEGGRVDPHDRAPLAVDGIPRRAQLHRGELVGGCPDGHARGHLRAAPVDERELAGSRRRQPGGTVLQHHLHRRRPLGRGHHHQSGRAQADDGGHREEAPRPTRLHAMARSCGTGTAARIAVQQRLGRRGPRARPRAAGSCGGRARRARPPSRRRR